MSDVDVMAAIIQKNAMSHLQGKFDFEPRNYLCTDGSVKKAAEALRDAGFRMSAGTADQEQNARLQAIESRLDRIEGYMVLPK